MMVYVCYLENVSLNSFSGPLCEINPCGNVTCLNGGNCAYGRCYCPPEFEGSNCQNSSTLAFDQQRLHNAIEHAARSVLKLEGRVEVAANHTSKRALKGLIRTVYRQYQEALMSQARANATKDFATPKVLGPGLVRSKDLNVPRDHYENAKIYEDQSIAYSKGHETHNAKLQDADLALRLSLEQKKLDDIVIAKDVPGGEYFGGFAEISDKYNPQDQSLLQADLAAYHHEDQSLMEELGLEDV